jgi:transcription termination factor Rho
MGVTYKAIDINLQCVVALKVISARLIGDESARRRFVREARAAASVRHPNVASVFHLGKSNEGYFYAMEYVEGETLESLIKRCGRLELKLALEIASQVAAGLAATHERNLVHRDIKPTNIMVSLKDGTRLIAKIIDLGLAKGLSEASPESAISVPGGFAGTPAFASPEQFAGIGVDIRSDLYSLGVVLWEMLTGQVPFRGTPAELIYQHQHGVLPRQQLKGVPLQVKTVLKTLLDKDPKRRFQTPAELLKTLSTIGSEVVKAADQTHEVHKPLAKNSTVVTEQPRPEPVYGEGLMEVSSDGFSFLRDPKRNYVQSPQDIAVTPEVVRKYSLRDGLWIKGEIRRGSRGSRLYRLTEINGEHPDRCRNLPIFEELTSVNPKSRIRLETVPDRYTTRVMDLMTPVGKGQRGLIVAPPRSGKTTLLQHIADAVIRNHPEVNLIILLIDERREAVTEMRRTVQQANIIASSNDSDFKSHIQIAQLAIERAKRLVEAGKDVIVLVDSLTRLGRAFNNAISNSGRIMSDGIDARAMEFLRKWFAAARNTEEAGSLTIIATALIETGSKIDELIFQEFKGTGNVEMVLDRQISDQGVYPAINIFKSGTRREELLIPANDLEKINTIRRGLAGHRPVEAIERLLSLLRKLPTNAQMLRETGSGREKPQKRSVAVLPFESLSANKKDTYFADGVQDEILSNLAKVSQLRVISRTSVMAFRSADNRNLRSIAETLDVGNVVEGTVRKDGKRTRITVRLVDARSDLAIWSETYDRDVSDIFTIQSEIAQMVASKLATTISPAEKKRIEAKATHNLEAYDLYMRAKQLIAYSAVNAIFGCYENHLIDAIALLEEAIRLDPLFTLAYCACAEANASLCFRYEWTSARRAFGDEAVRHALRLQPELPEVHLAYARHLYGVDRDYERAKGELSIARRGLPNDVRVILAAAWIDRRQGRWDEAIRGFHDAISLDPRNVAPLVYLGNTLANLRRFVDAEEAYNRAINLDPDNLMLKAQEALWLTRKTGDAAPLSSVISALPRLTAEDSGVLAWRLICALVGRNWPQATELITQMKGSDVLNFSYIVGPVPVNCYSILLSRIQGGQPRKNPAFTEIRENLNQKVKASPESAGLLSNLAVIDALLGQKQTAIDEAKRSVEMLLISQDIAGGPAALKNLAVVYTWTDETELAFETLNSVAKVPAGIYYGDLKLDLYWDPLRRDPRFQKILADLAPDD